jgi:mRNA-degrading endonuclease RelE of RelBE toxin-antitoxin system
MKKTAAVNLRMTEELRAKLQRLADENRRQLSDYIRLVLEDHANADEERRARKAARTARPQGTES